MAELEAATVGAILAAYLDDRAQERVAGLERIRWSHKALQRHLGSRLPATLDDTTARFYAKQRAVEPGGPHGRRPGQATIRTELVALQAALRWAARKKLIPDIPDTGKLPPQAAPRDRWLTRDEVRRLLAECVHPHIRLFVMLALHTGARHRAVLGLTWDRVDLDGRHIDFREPSLAVTRKRRPRVPINNTLLAELKRAHEMAISTSVIEHGGHALASVKHGFCQACRRAGLKGVTPHVLRHTAGTWMAQEGISLWDIAGMLGDTMVTVEKNYAHHSPEYLRDAARALG